MTKILKRMVAVMLIFTLALIAPMQNIRSDAAEKSVKYIKEFKLFIKKQGGLADAKEWCRSQTDADWHVVEKDLNDGADAMFTKPVGVFLCYCTTENPKEAVRDIAVMNEKGNYSESLYEQILNTQKGEYRDLVKNLKLQVKNYQNNLKNNVKTAVEARDILNEYKEDDSGKLLGDILAELDLDQEKDVEKLTDILLQANGQVVLFIQQQLTLASESGNRSWLDRMEQVGGYDKLYAKFKTAYNGDDTLAKRNMDAKFKEKASVIADSWDELKEHFDNVKKYEERSGITSMSEEQLVEWKKNNLKSPEGAIYEQESAFVSNLAKYKYEGKTLLSFFSQDKSEISDKNLYKLYPMVASLQDGQFAGIDSSVNLYMLVNQAFSATLLNDYEKGKLGEAKNEMNAEEKTDLEKSQKNLENMLDLQKKGEVKSIYEGVDREVFNGGVAVTSDALEYSKGSEIKWTEQFYNKIGVTQSLTAIGLFIGISATMTMAAVKNSMLEKTAQSVVHDFHVGDQADDISQEIIDLVDNTYYKVNAFEKDGIVTHQIEKLANSGDKGGQAAWDAIIKESYKRNTTARVLQGIKIGMSIALLLVTVADIALTVYSLYQVYNKDHLPIPKCMVDLSTNENKETSYVTYKTVRDNSGNPGDLNGNSSRQWLALYQTYDDRVGEPIVAPESGYPITVIYGKNSTKSDQSPLHMFGTVNVAQNLTFSDGDSGYSYRDGRGGIYLYFTRFDGKTTEEKTEPETQEETVSKTSSDGTSETASAVADTENGGKTDGEDQNATVMSSGTIVLIGCSSIALLVIVILAINYSRRRKSQ